MSTPAHIIASLNTLAEQKAQELLARAKKILDTPKYRASGELVDSLEVSVEKGTETEPPVITLTFSDQGFFLSMKNPSWSKVPWRSGKRGLVEWVRKRGSSSFAYVSGYGRGQSSSLSEDAKVKKIASGIAWAYRNHSLKWKTKTWKKQTLVSLLTELNEQTARVWEDGIVVGVESELYSKT
ncbi:MAG: hypothetical protein ACK500_12450 [Flavobacteriales bacterium]|jgi:hypothetical protein